VKSARAQWLSRNGIESLVLAIWFDQPTNPLVRFLFWLVGTPLSWLTRSKANAARERINKAKAIAPTPPVLIVGNLIAGGAGKTPLTIALTNALTQRNLRIGIICRGDGARSRILAPVMVTRQSQADAVGDEAILLFHSTQQPVCVCARRDEARRLLLETYPDTDLVISDDGLQHEALNRTIELAVFDQRGVGNGRLLPAGPLREPLSHLADMDGLILNNGFGGAVHAADPVITHPRSFTSPMSIRDIVSLDEFRQGDLARDGQSVAQFAQFHSDKPIAALAGIANPEPFFASLESAGLPIRKVALADHATLGTNDLAAISEPIIIMTAKDAVKCPADPRVYVLRVQANPPTDLINWITEQFNGLPAS
jgi:tetraacyldisaccharide 4'-kinase